MPSRRRLARALPWLLLLVFCVRGLLAMRADGTTVDEPLHLSYGQRALASGTFLRDQQLLNSKMPVSVLNALPVAIANLAAPANGASGDRRPPLTWSRELFLARLPSLFLAALLGWLVWRWAVQLFGPWSGILALLLYTFCPNMLAHGHLVTTDVATALAMFGATYCLWRYLSAPSRGRLLLAAATFGLAQLTKATALFLVPMFVVLFGAQVVGDLAAAHRAAPLSGRDAARRLGRSAVRGTTLFTVFLLAAVAVLNVGFWFERTGTPLREFTFVSPACRSLAAKPWLRALPVPVPYAYLQGLDMVLRDSRAGDWSYLRGEYSQTGFRSYFLWAFLVKVPLPTQILLWIAFGLWATGRVRAPGAEWFLIVPVFVSLAYLSLLLQLDIGFRYFLPALPFLFVFASRVAAAMTVAAAARRTSAHLWRPLLVGLLLVWLAISSFRIHPHYLAYFNELAGGPDGGSRWLIDSNLDWGQDSEAARRTYALHGPLPALIDPSGPIAGRVVVGVSNLVGRDPEAARRHAWLRDNFQPTASLGHSWQVFDVSQAVLDRCCAAPVPTWLVADLAQDEALDGEPFGDGEGVAVRFQERLNDGMLGANEPVDAARTTPPRRQPVRAAFGIRWPTPRSIGRIVAFPGFASRGPNARADLALDYVLQSWDGTAWRDIPGTAVAGNRALRIEHRFPPLRTDQIRLLIERERDERGGASPAVGFRAACLEIAAYPN